MVLNSMFVCNLKKLQVSQFKLSTYLSFYPIIDLVHYKFWFELCGERKFKNTLWAWLEPCEKRSTQLTKSQVKWKLEFKNTMQQKGKKIKRFTNFLDCIFIVGG
jgi:hypothetical protein